jgi:enamine deaminase RidA (YjgF/YER057c/UK114 family)
MAVASTTTPVSPEPDPILDRFGFHQGRLVRDAGQLLFLAGQVGDPADNLEGQLTTALHRLFGLLARAGMEPADLTRLTILTTDVDGLLAVWPVVRTAFAPGPVPPNTLAQVVRFAHPAVLVEIDGIAAR